MRTIAGLLLIIACLTASEARAGCEPLWIEACCGVCATDPENSMCTDDFDKKCCHKAARFQHVQTTVLTMNPMVSNSVEVKTTIANLGEIGAPVVIKFSFERPVGMPVFERFLEPVTIEEGGEHTFTVLWTPEVAGDYSVVVNSFQLGTDCMYQSARPLVISVGEMPEMCVIEEKICANPCAPCPKAPDCKCTPIPDCSLTCAPQVPCGDCNITCGPPEIVVGNDCGPSFCRDKCSVYLGQGLTMMGAIRTCTSLGYGKHLCKERVKRCWVECE